MISFGDGAASNEMEIDLDTVKPGRTVRGQWYAAEPVSQELRGMTAAGTFWHSAGNGLMTSIRANVLVAPKTGGLVSMNYFFKDLWDGTGWSRTKVNGGARTVRSIAENVAGAGSPYMYTFEGSSLRRYTYEKPKDGGAPPLRAAGTKSGFGTYRGLQGLRSTAAADHLVATTSKGALMLITVPKTSRFAPSFTPLRPATWGAITSLVTAPCRSDTAVLGVNGRTGHVHAYRVGPIARKPTATRITSYGLVTGGKTVAPQVTRLHRVLN